MTHVHAVVWLDHREARIMQFSAEEVQQQLVHAPAAHRHIHSKHSQHEKHSLNAPYYREISDDLRGVKEILVVGPGAAKLELVKYVHEHAAELVPHVVGVESVDHPSDGQLLAYARKYFKAVDRMI